MGLASLWHVESSWTGPSIEPVYPSMAREFLWCSCKESAWNAGDPGLISGLGGSPGGENGNPLQYSCLENSMDRGACRATVHGVAKSWTQLSTHTHTHTPSLAGGDTHPPHTHTPSLAGGFLTTGPIGKS